MPKALLTQKLLLLLLAVVVLITSASKSYKLNPYAPQIITHQQALRFKLNTLSWHRSFYTIGLDQSTSIDNPNPLPAHQATLHQLAPNQGKNITIVMIDTEIPCSPLHPDLPDLATVNKMARATNKTDTYIPDITASHAIHLYGLLKNTRKDLCGICPQATVIPIKACSKQGKTDAKTIINALKQAITLKPDILLFPILFDQNITPDLPIAQKITSLLNQIPYVIIPSGNISYPDNFLPFPASSPATTFVVSAYGYNNLKITPFPKDQLKSSTIRKVALPGVALLSTALPSPTDPAPYLIMTGTSGAAALMAGFLALVLSEFQQKLTKKQIIHTIQSAHLYKPHKKPYRHTRHTHRRTKNNPPILDLRHTLSLLHKKFKTLKSNTNTNNTPLTQPLDTSAATTRKRGKGEPIRQKEKQRTKANKIKVMQAIKKRKKRRRHYKPLRKLDKTKTVTKIV